MATDDVPGKNPSNADKLAMGCWAEAADKNDKSLIFVESVEGGNVVFSMFDVDNDLEYRDAMALKEFETFFTFDPKSSKHGKVTGSLRWTWHDKTPFDWRRVMKSMKPGPRFSSADALLSAAAKVAKALGIRGKKLEANGHTISATSRTRGIVEGIKAVLDKYEGQSRIAHDDEDEDA